MTDNVEDGQVVEQIDENLPPPEIPEVDEQAEIEARARRMGWKPKEEYRGPPGRWRDARTFIDHGENELPVLRERLRALDQRSQDTEAKLTNELSDYKQRLTETHEVVAELREIAKRSEERGYARAKAEIEAQMRAAVETSDVPRFNAAKAELDALEADRPAPKEARREPPAAPPVQQPAAAPNPGAIDPEITSWTAQNPWFDRDPVLKAFAIAEDSNLMAKYPGMSTRDRLDEVTKKTLAKFPEKFGSSRRQAAPVSGSSPPPPRQPNAKSYENLPSDAKAACDKFVATIPGYTKEQYVKQYFAE